MLFVVFLCVLVFVVVRGSLFLLFLIFCVWVRFSVLYDVVCCLCACLRYLLIVVLFVSVLICCVVVAVCVFCRCFRGWRYCCCVWLLCCYVCLLLCVCLLIPLSLFIGMMYCRFVCV